MLPDHVRDVLRVGAFAQMRGVAAGRVVAHVVPRLHHRRQRPTKSYRERVPVGANCLALRWVEDAIAAALSPSGPRPAGVGSAGPVDLGPEAGLDFDRSDVCQASSFRTHGARTVVKPWSKVVK